jgi:Serine dehydrogenase proteinase
MTTRYLLVYFNDDSLDRDSIVPIRRALEDEVKELRDEVEIDVWLESPGGSADAAYKLALMLRHTAKLIRIIVPDFAKSAATLLALAGHEIYMAPGAELGPLDMQLYDEGNMLQYTSALNIAKAADDLASDAVELSIHGGAHFLFSTRLSRVQTMTSMLKFAAEFYAPLVSQLDPKVVYDAKQALRSAKNYAKDIMAETCGVTATTMAARLVENYPTHGFVISYHEAKKLGLPVSPITDYDLLEHVRRLHRAYEDGPPIVQFTSMAEFLDEARVTKMRATKTTGPTKVTKRTSGTEKLKTATEEHACETPQEDRCERHPESAPSEFFISPLREPLTEEEVRAAWSGASN